MYYQQFHVHMDLQANLFYVVYTSVTLYDDDLEEASN